MFSSGNANMDINTNPCYCIASDSDMTLSGLGLGPYLPWLQVVGLARHSWLLLSPSSLQSHLSSERSSCSTSLSLPSDHHRLSHGGFCCRLAMCLVGPRVTSSIHAVWCNYKQVSWSTCARS